MSLLDRCTAALGDANVRAWLEVIADGESGHTNDAWRIANVGGAYPANPIVHPWYGRTTTEVGHSTAFGKFQFLGTSAKEACSALGLDGSVDFGPIVQQLCAVWTIDIKRNALAEVMAGNVLAAAAKLDDEWVALRSMAPERIKRVFAQYGGKTAAQNDAGATISPVEVSTPQITPQRPAMDPLTIISLFGPILSQLIPQISKVFGGDKDKANLEVAGKIIDTVVTASGQPNVMAAVDAMKADKALTAKITETLVTTPGIMELIEIGGGVAKAREQNIALVQSADKWWKLVFNPVLIVTVICLPLVYIIVWRLVAYMDKVSADVIAQTIGTVIGLVLGSVMGFWMGQTYTQGQQRRQNDANPQA